MKRMLVFSSASLTVISLWSLAPNTIVAGQIGPEGFTAAADVQDFDVLGSSTISHVAPILIGIDSFDSDDHLLRSSGKFGPLIGRSGIALSNDPGSSDSSVGFIDIDLGNPAFRAGLYVGFEFPWSANVEFYNTASNLLGTIALSGNGKDNSFAGWQTDDEPIQRVRVIDTVNDGSAIIIDDLIQEVPEPLSTLQFLIGVLPLIGFWRRRRDAGGNVLPAIHF